MNCILIDDEYPAIQELSYFVANFSSIKILGEFADGIKALEFLQVHPVDVIFLDINMPNLDGLTLSKILNTLKTKPLLVFISAYREYALDAFQVSAYDYILKPYSESRIVDTLNRLESYACTRFTGKITLWKNNKLCVLNLNDIFYCQSNEHEVLIYTKEDEYRITSGISDFHKRLPQDNFFRCHRSYIVNLDKIREIIPWFNNTYMLKLQFLDTEIPVSRQNISIFKQLMGI
jgi:two-component system, LytTR family, response regulator